MPGNEVFEAGKGEFSPPGQALLLRTCRERSGGARFEAPVLGGLDSAGVDGRMGANRSGPARVHALSQEAGS